MSDLRTPPPLLLGPADCAELSLKAKRARALTVTGRTRAANFLPRTLSTLFAVFVMMVLYRSATPLIWFALFVPVVWFDRKLYTDLARNAEAGEPASDLRPMVAWTFAQSCYANILAPVLWFAPYQHGETLAVIYIIAGLANAAASLRASTPLMLAGVLPTVAVLLGLPILEFIEAGGRNPLALTLLIGAVLFLAFGFNLWRSLVASDLAQERAELAAARERQSAAAAAAAKSDTIRRMRDEMRTPMAALIGAAEHLRRVATSPEARRHIAMLAQAGEVLRLVLEDLSDLDSLENGLIRVDARSTDPRELARNVVDAFAAAAQDKGLEIFLDIAPDTPARVELDPLRVRQILFNLVANAVRYTTHGGVRVELKWQPASTPDRVKLGFVVSDTGCGMSRSQLAIVLGRARLNDGGHTAQGPGLGLSISLRLARLMGANLVGQSELGQGSVFSLVIEAPLAEPAGLRKSRSAA